jgi:hypothetical protein
LRLADRSFPSTEMCFLQYTERCLKFSTLM